jgi:hypothetical protein
VRGNLKVHASFPADAVIYDAAHMRLARAAPEQLPQTPAVLSLQQTPNCYFTFIRSQYILDSQIPPIEARQYEHSSRNT